jgi:PST family polysaccharide transporter
MDSDRDCGLAPAAAVANDHADRDPESPLQSPAGLPPEAFNASTDRSALKRASVHGVAVTFLSQALRFVLQFGAQIVLAHWLLPRQFGLIAMVAPVLSLVQVFNDLGLTQATIQRPEITHRELSTLFWINFGVSAALAAAMVALSPLVAWFYHEPRLMPVTAACGSLLLLSGAGAQQIALMNRRMRYTPLAIIDVACAFMAFVVGLAAAALGFGYWSLVMMQAANSLTILLLVWAFSDWRPSWPSRDPGVMALLRFGGHLTGFNILGYAENNLGTVLIGRFSGAPALGLYDRAFKLVIVPWWQISLPVARVSISLLCRLHGSDAHYTRAYRQMLQGLLLVAAPGLIWAAIEANTLVPLVLGRSWAAAAPIVAWLSVGTILVPLGSSAYWLFVSQNRVAAQLRYGVASGILLVTSIVVGIHWGPIGVARCYAAFGPFIQGVQLWGATRQGPVGMATVLRAIYPIALSVGAAAAGLEWLLRMQGGAPSLAGLGAGLFLSYGVAGLALLCFPAGRSILGDVWDVRRVLRPA